MAKTLTIYIRDVDNKTGNVKHAAVAIIDYAMLDQQINGHRAEMVSDTFKTLEEKYNQEVTKG